jgi:hypothetical protein
MKKFFLVLLLVACAFQGYAKYRSGRHVDPVALAAPVPTLADPLPMLAAPVPTLAPAQSSVPSESFACDGRTYCSQMHSCAEAEYFLKNCPGTKMDGNHDGVPCERQWCR